MSIWEFPYEVKSAHLLHERNGWFLKFLYTDKTGPMYGIKFTDPVAIDDALRRAGINQEHYGQVVTYAQRCLKELYGDDFDVSAEAYTEED